MKRYLKKLLRLENAQTMVEFALVFPLVLLITYGLIEFGRMVFIYAAVTGSAREGARYGAAAGGDVGGVIPKYADCPKIRAAVRGVAFLLTIPDNMIEISYDHGPGAGQVAPSCPPYDANGDSLIQLGDRIVVRVTAHYAPVIAFLGFQGFDIVSENARTILVSVAIVGTPPPPIRSLTPTPTDTPTPTETPTPTQTQTPTQTPTGTISPTPTQTNTPGGPTETATVSPTPTVTPTPTPTYTPTPVCVINGGAFAFAVPNANSFSWTLTSLGADPVRLIDATISWPNTSPAAKLQEIQVGVNTVWTGNKQPPTVHVCETGCPDGSWSGAANLRQLSPGGSHTLVFWFSRSIPHGVGMTYSVALIYQNLTTGGTCSISQSAVYP